MSRRHSQHRDPHRLGIANARKSTMNSLKIKGDRQLKMPILVARSGAQAAFRSLSRRTYSAMQAELNLPSEPRAGPDIKVLIVGAGNSGYPLAMALLTGSQLWLGRRSKIASHGCRPNAHHDSRGIIQSDSRRSWGTG